MAIRTRKGNAGDAAVLIIIITAVLVLYILFLSPEDRAELLGEENATSADDVETKSGFNKTLLKEQIGRLDYLKFDSRQYDIPSFRVYSQEEGSILKKSSSLYVKSALGDKRLHNLSFEINKKLTSNVKLSFNVVDTKGRLEIYLNGHEIYNGEARKGTPNPIDLSSSMLDYENVLTFKVSSPGIAFWRTNEYTLQNVVITGDILDLSNSISRQYFFISEVEVLNLDTVKLRFYPGCDVRDVGNLNIYLNGYETFSGVADCGIYQVINLDKNAVREGKNELEFIANEGSYLFDRVSVSTQLEDLIYPVYYFDMEEEVFFDMDLKDDFNVTLTIRFVNDDDKRMEYLINGRRRHIDTDDLIFTERIDDYVFPETNSIELVPKSVIDIAELKILLDEE